MNRFAALLDRLAYQPGRNAKLRLLTDYFRTTVDPDRGYALAAITGSLSFRYAKPGLIRTLIAERTDPAAPGGSAEIVYDKYCRIPVKPGRVAVVAPVSPCARGADLGPPAAPFPVKAAPPAESQDNTGYYLLGGAAAVGLGVGIWALTKSSSSSPAPASP
jgi:DNA ligase-1